MNKFDLSEKQEIYKIPMGGENIPFYWQEDVKEFIRLSWEKFCECRDKTDIWDNERWEDFENMFEKEIDKLCGEKLK
jgi:hypothetical protein